MITSHHLDQTKIEVRSQAIEDALGFVAETERLDAAIAPPQATRTQRFTELANALRARDLKIVVIGEYSRGKSFLLNALLGVKILPTAQKQTTCINTFILGTDRPEPYLSVQFRDGQAPLELPWEAGMIDRWGTELDKENKDARSLVDRIHACSNHQLFQHGLVLIDTPGFGGILDHHEEVALQAIDEAHVALWILSAEQLGGTATEWTFLRETISRNFNKFVTVVNKWDLVLDPKDAQDIERLQCDNPLERARRLREMETEKLQEVRDHFESMGSFLGADQVAVLTDDDHLMGVSAHWALSKDERERDRSNIERLGERIMQLCVGNEAKQQMLLTPLTKLLAIQADLKKELDRELAGLEAAGDQQALRTDCERAESEVRRLTQDRTIAEKEARIEHNETAIQKAKELQDQLVAPLVELKEVLEEAVTEEFVRRQIEARASQIELPEEIRQEFEEVTGEVARKWDGMREDLLRTLERLRVAFAKMMEDSTSRLTEAFRGSTLEFPPFELDFKVDLGAIERYQAERSQLEAKAAELEAQHDETEAELRSLQVDPARRAAAEQKLRRVEERIRLLGPQPSPITITESRDVLVKKGGMYSNDQYRPEPIQKIDWGNVKAHQRELGELKQREQAADEEIASIIKEEEARTGKRISVEFARKKLEGKLSQRRRELERLRGEEQRTQDQVVAETYQRLRRTTVHHVEKLAALLEKNAATAIERLFNDQLAAMLACVEEHYVEPLQREHARLEGLQKAVLEGDEEVARKKAAAQAHLAALNELTTHTYDLFEQVQRRL